MRILLVNKFWRPVGGVEEHAFLVKRTLECLGHTVVPFSMQDSENLETPYDKYFVPPVEFRGGSTATRLHAVGRASLGLATVRRIRQVVREEQIDVAHVLHAYHHLGMTFLLELRRLKVPTVLSLHDYKISCPNYRFFTDRDGTICTRCIDHKSGFLWAPAVTRCWDGSATAGVMLTVEAASNKLLRTYTRGPGAVIVLNALQRRAVISAGVDEQRVHVIPHFVEVRTPVRQERLRQVLFVGRLVPEKGVDVLVRACAQAGVRLLVVGDGRDREALQQLASNEGCDASFVGEQDRQAVQRAMRESAVLAVPSLWHEVSPLVILEAIELGLPVVGSDVGGIPDLIGAGRGVIAPPGEQEAWASAIRAVIDDLPYAERLAAEAWAYADRNWTRDRWLDSLSHAYSSAGAPALR
jgi:glycosyltransferase involved in cell wall biosynthesis